MSIADSIEEVIKAKTEQNNARNNYSGYNWGYHGYEFQCRVDDAEATLKSELDDYIDNRIKEYLSKESK